MTESKDIIKPSSLSIKICSVDTCNGKVKAHGYCSKHYAQIKRHGKISKSIYDPNEIVFVNNDCHIILTNRKMDEIGIAVIDKKDYTLIKGYKWYISHDNYVKSDSTKDRPYLHRLIMGCPKNMHIDHIDFNPLNNKRSNLRICTNQQNVFHQHGVKNSSSKYKGISFYKPSKMWRARIGENSNQTHIGHFKTEIEAAIAYNEYAIKYHKEFCFLNEIDGAI